MAGAGEIDHDLLTRVLSEFAHTLANRYEVSEVLYRLAEHVVEILQVAGAGVSVAADDGQLRRVTVINELTDQLETVEEAHQEGPCVDAFRHGQVVLVPDLAAEAGTWPTWSAQAAAWGVVAVMGIPMWIRDRAVGAMNVYSTEVRTWSEAEVRTARVLADMAASYVVNASELEASRRTAEQLQEALDSRVLIEQAKGMLANENRVSVDEAFRLLRRHAREHGASLRAVARAVVELGLRPPLRRGQEAGGRGSQNRPTPSSSVREQTNAGVSRRGDPEDG